MKTGSNVVDSCSVLATKPVVILLPRQYLLWSKIYSPYFFLTVTLYGEGLLF